MDAMEPMEHIEPKSYFAQVVVNIPLDKIFTYQIPNHLIDKAAVGKRVLIPFRSRQLIGHIIDIIDRSGIGDLTGIKPVLDVLDDLPLISPSLLQLNKWIADYYLSSLGSVMASSLPIGFKKESIPVKRVKYARLTAPQNPELEIFLSKVEKKAPKQAAIINMLKQLGGGSTLTELIKTTRATSSSIHCLVDKGLIAITEQEVYRSPDRLSDHAPIRDIIPNQEQQRAIEQIRHGVSKGEFTPCLLYGITGSGKTLVYLKTVEYALEMGKTALIMVPEISLTHQLINLFHSFFGRNIAVLHSALSDGERLDEWRRIWKGEAKVAIGARSAVFAPLENLGLIILDEEHETSYKQDHSPRYHARNVAMMRAKMAGATLVLGSATPCLESFYAVRQGRFTLLHLSGRATPHPLSDVKLVDMRKEFKEQKKQSLFSRSLIEAISLRVQKKEQSILFLNRRGFSNFLLCVDCGHVPQCINCSVSLTYHADEDRLRCHYCNYMSRPPLTCPDCKKGKIQLMGFGTQRVEDEARRLFPSAVIERMDQDTVTRKASHQKILSRLGKGEIDLLIGTQMIAKGLDLPRVNTLIVEQCEDFGSRC